MDPDLIEFFGGLDLRMTKRQMKKLEPRLRSYDSSGLLYAGASINNRSIELDVFTSSNILLFQILDLFDLSRIERISANFEDDYLASSRLKSFDFWLSYFESALNKTPVHFFDPTENYYKDIYLWHFDHYNFEIWRNKYEPIYSNRSLHFNAYLAGEEYPNYYDMTEIFEITSTGDTIQYSFLHTDIKEIFGGFDIGMTTTNVQEKAAVYTLDKKKDIYCLDLADNSTLELYVRDPLTPPNPLVIDGNVYKMILKLYSNNEYLEKPILKNDLIDNIEKKLELEPIKFKLQNGYIRSSIVLWHFPSYNFEIRLQYSDASEIQIVSFYAYKDSDSIPNGEADKNLSIFDLDWDIEK